MEKKQQYEFVEFNDYAKTQLIVGKTYFVTLDNGLQFTGEWHISKRFKDGSFTLEDVVSVLLPLTLQRAEVTDWDEVWNNFVLDRTEKYKSNLEVEMSFIDFLKSNYSLPISNSSDSGAVEFINWLYENKWKLDKDSFCYKMGGHYKTTAELLTIYKNKK